MIVPYGPYGPRRGIYFNRSRRQLLVAGVAVAALMVFLMLVFSLFAN